MGKAGDITLSNLKSATGIADDRLSAHNPSGPGNTTSLGDFLIDNIGRFDSSNLVWVTDLERVNPGSPKILAKGISGHDQFEVEIQFSFAADGLLWAPAIGRDGNNLTATGSDFIELSRTVTSNSATNTRGALKVTCEVDAFNSIFFQATLSGALNNDATNHNTSLIYDSTNDSQTEVLSDSPRVTEITLTQFDSVNDEIDLLVDVYDPNNQLSTPFIDFDINPNNQLARVTAGGSFSLPTFQATNLDLSTISSNNDPHTVRTILRDGSGGTIEDQHSFDYNKSAEVSKGITDLHA